MSEETNRILAKIVLTLILVVVVAGGIFMIADGQADGFGAFLLVIFLIIVVIGLGRAIIER